MIRIDAAYSNFGLSSAPYLWLAWHAVFQISASVQAPVDWIMLRTRTPQRQAKRWAPIHDLVIPAYTTTPTSAVLFRSPSPNINMRGVSLATVCAGFVASATAQTVSLYLPLFDPQPLTADVAGVGAGGQTTWLVRGSGGPEGGFIGTATLVQGPTGASFTFASPEATGLTLGYECTFEGENAVCSGADEDGTVVTETDSIEFLDVTLGTTVPGAQVTSAPDASTTSSAGTASTTSSGTRNGGSSTTSTAPTGTPSNGGLMQKTVPLSVILLMFGASSLLLA
ncbi:hypothetical protein NMY22_g5609 [Coprinellus aureogranulatus]|nr:hypothetical protein NMY22_g5609 [Coprinellus aureogranulatus]